MQTQKQNKMRRTAEERRALEQESLYRAQDGDENNNYAIIYRQFEARGIPTSEIMPRENIFTFSAWKAKGRFVKRGEKGVGITTYFSTPVEIDEETGKSKGGTRLYRTAYVFHISQTEAMEGRKTFV